MLSNLKNVLTETEVKSRRTRPGGAATRTTGKAAWPWRDRGRRARRQQRREARGGSMCPCAGRVRHDVESTRTCGFASPTSLAGAPRRCFHDRQQNERGAAQRRSLPMKYYYYSYQIRASTIAGYKLAVRTCTWRWEEERERKRATYLQPAIARTPIHYVCGRWDYIKGVVYSYR